MPKNPDRDETLVLELGDFRRHMLNRLGADGVICERDQAVIREFDEPFREMANRIQVRKSFESIMRNGASRHARTTARDAGIAIVVNQEGQVADIVMFPETDPERAA